MYSTSDFEKLWFLYQTEGSPKGISINTYCANQGILYTPFYDWLCSSYAENAQLKKDISAIVSRLSVLNGEHYGSSKSQKGLTKR